MLRAGNGLLKQPVRTVANLNRAGKMRIDTEIKISRFGDKSLSTKREVIFHIKLYAYITDLLLLTPQLYILELLEYIIVEDLDVGALHA